MLFSYDIAPGLGRRTLIVGSLGALAACAMQPVALDRTTMLDVKRVGLPTPGFPTAPTVDVINGVGKSLGSIGIIATAIVEGNRSTAVSDLMAAQGFQPQDYFQQQVAARLQRRGLAVVAETADPKRQAFLKEYAAASVNDAVLDVYVSGYGFVAASDSDDSPYRPAVSVSMRLVHAADRAILMQDKLTNVGIDVTAASPATAPAFVTFDAVKRDPAQAVAALQFALSYAADAVGARLA